MRPSTRHRLQRFRAHRRGWRSLLLLAFAYGASLLAPVLISNRALAVHYRGELFFPAFSGFHAAESFGQRSIGEADYRRLDREIASMDPDGWVLLPPYPYHPNESLLRDPSVSGPPPHPPSASHWFGTDDRGRDVLARLVHGLRISMNFGLGVVLLAYIFGITVGACLGFLGGRVDLWGQRLVEIWSGMPFLYTVIILSALVRPTLWLLIPIMAAFSWMGISYYMRGEFLREKRRDYATAAVASGESRRGVALHHILSNALSPALSLAPFALASAILSLAALDYLGFGLPAPTPSLGELIDQGLRNMRAWHLVVVPLSALSLTLIAVVFAGEGIRDALAADATSPQEADA